MRAVRRRRARHRAFTLVEMLVVIVLLGLAVGLAAPALRAPRPAADGLATLLPVAREAAVRRGETVYLRVAESGAWRLEGASSAADGAFGSGRVAPFAGVPLTLVVSPLGSCAFDAPDAGRALPLDPLTCRLRAAPGPR
jgi:prepilin-type N-terminal cleavage/methylation domain-containing protein